MSTIVIIAWDRQPAPAARLALSLSASHDTSSISASGYVNVTPSTRPPASPIIRHQAPLQESASAASPSPLNSRKGVMRTNSPAARHASEIAAFPSMVPPTASSDCRRREMPAARAHRLQPQGAGQIAEAPG